MDFYNALSDPTNGLNLNEITNVPTNDIHLASKLEQIILPYNPEEDPKKISAVGLYLNYLEIEQAVIVPIFGLDTDAKAVKIIEDVFQEKTVRTLECSELARKGGGILNCITWNILA